MCILFTSLIYAYFSQIFLSSSETWLIGIVVITCIVVLDYFTRMYVKNLILFFIIHILFVAAGVIIPSNVLDRFLLGTIAFSFLLMAFNFWKTEVNERINIAIDVPAGATIAFIIVYIQTTFALSKELNTFAYVTGIAFFLLSFLRKYLDKFYAYSLRSNTFSKELGNTFSVNLSLIGLFNLVSIFFIMTLNTFFSDSSFNVIGKFFKRISRAMVGCIEKNTSAPIELPPDSAVTSTTQTAGNVEHLMGEYHQSKFGQAFTIFFDIMQFVIFTVLSLIVFYIIYSFIKQYLHRNTLTGDVVKKTEKKTRVNDITDSKDEEKSHSLFLTNREKIRKIFVTTVNQATKKNNRIVLRKSYTPDQINNAIKTTVNSDTEQLTELYKEARYSDHEITKADVDRAKKM